MSRLSQPDFLKFPRSPNISHYNLQIRRSSVKMLNFSKKAISEQELGGIVIDSDFMLMLCTKIFLSILQFFNRISSDQTKNISDNYK